MDFLEIYDNSLTKKECNDIIELFEDHSHLHAKGKAGGGVDPEKKKGVSLDFTIDQTRWSGIDRAVAYILMPALNKAINKYKKKYHLLENIQKWGLNTDYHMQRMDKGDGYFVIHCEQELQTSTRLIAWMFYLNNAKCGTRFHYQNRTIKARRGRLVLWPCGWTHMHNGVVPNIDPKYIMTGWYSFYDESKWVQIK